MSRRNSADTEREAAIRILAPTFSGSADSMARVLRNWASERPERRDARDLGLHRRGHGHRQALVREQCLARPGHLRRPP